MKSLVQLNKIPAAKQIGHDYLALAKNRPAMQNGAALVSNLLKQLETAPADGRPKAKARHSRTVPRHQDVRTQRRTGRAGPPLPMGGRSDKRKLIPLPALPQGATGKGDQPVPALPPGFRKQPSK